METMRLRSIQQPGRVDRLLELFIIGTNRVPQDAYHVRSPSGLSHDLRVIVQEAQQKHRAWSVWTDDHGTWLFTGEMSLALSRERATVCIVTMGVVKTNLCETSGNLQQHRKIARRSGSG